MPIFENLEDELRQLISKGLVNWNLNQICLNAPGGKSHDWTLGCKSLYYNWDKVVKDKAGNIVHLPKFEHPLYDEDFIVLCDVFRGTIFEEVFNLLNDRYTIGRLRLMRSVPFACTSWHKDVSKRLHYPIKTDQSCKMVIENEVFHIPYNEWWITNTEKMHAAFNGSRSERIHLVGVLL